MAEQLTYLAAPNFTFRPYTGPIALGNIVADPKKPHRVLSVVDSAVLEAKYPRVEKVPEGHHLVTRGATNSVSGAVWAQFWQVASAKASAEHSNHNLKTYSMDGLVTEYFVFDPEQAEIESRLANPKIASVMKPSNRLKRNPVYMVNGIKIAKGLKVTYERGSSSSGNLAASGSVPTPAGNVEVGAEAGAARERTSTDESNYIGDVIFAYQLLVIEYTNWSRTKLKVDEYQPTSGFQSNTAEKIKDLEDGPLGHRRAEDDDLYGEGMNKTVIKVGDAGSTVTVLTFEEGL